MASRARRSFLVIAAGCALALSCETVETPAITRLPDAAARDSASPDASACFEASSGGPTSCKPEETWNAYAVDDCAGRGLRLAVRRFEGSCAPGAYRSIAYACCPAPDAGAIDQ